MNKVEDRIVQYPNRYQLKNTETGEVLGTFDLVAVPGIVQTEGTHINKSLFDSIATDISNSENSAVLQAKNNTDTAVNQAKQELNEEIVKKESKENLGALAYKNFLTKEDVGLGNVQNTPNAEMNVNHADTAGHADTANFANEASTAGLAYNANSANNAIRADYAYKADLATEADHALRAENAGSAGSAESAGIANEVSSNSAIAKTVKNLENDLDALTTEVNSIVYDEFLAFESGKITPNGVSYSSGDSYVKISFSLNPAFEDMIKSGDILRFHITRIESSRKQNSSFVFDVQIPPLTIDKSHAGEYIGLYANALVKGTSSSSSAPYLVLISPEGYISKTSLGVLDEFSVTLNNIRESFFMTSSDVSVTSHKFGSADGNYKVTKICRLRKRTLS